MSLLKLKFNATLDYQKHAVQAVVDLFEEQPLAQDAFTVSVGQQTGAVSFHQTVMDLAALPPFQTNWYLLRNTCSETCVKCRKLTTLFSLMNCLVPRLPQSRKMKKAPISLKSMCRIFRSRWKPVRVKPTFTCVLYLNSIRPMGLPSLLSQCRVCRSAKGC